MKSRPKAARPEAEGEAVKAGAMHQAEDVNVQAGAMHQTGSAVHRTSKYTRIGLVATRALLVSSILTARWSGRVKYPSSLRDYSGTYDRIYSKSLNDVH